MTKNESVGDLPRLNTGKTKIYGMRAEMFASVWANSPEEAKKGFQEAMKTHIEHMTIDVLPPCDVCYQNMPGYDVREGTIDKKIGLVNYYSVDATKQ